MPRTAIRATLSYRPGLAALAEPVAVLMLVPLFFVAVASLGGQSAAENYANWWAGARGWQILWRTVQLSVLAGGAAMLLAWALVGAAGACSGRFATLAAILSCLPMLVPSSTLATAWIAATGAAGPIGGVLQRLGFRVFSLPSAAVVLAMRYFGVAAVVLCHYRLRRRAVDPAGRVFDIPATTKWFHLRFRPGLRVSVAAALLVALLAMNDHIIPDMLLVSTFGPQVLIRYSALMDPAGAAALAIPVAMLGLGAVLLALRIGGRTWSATAPVAPVAPARPLPLRLVGGAVAGGILAAVMGIPLAVLVVRAGGVSAVVDALYDARRQVGWTLFCVAVASPVCVLLASMLAGRWVRRRRAGRISAVPAVLLNLIVPASLPAIGVIEMFNRLPSRVADSPLPLIIAYVVRFTPLVMLGFFALRLHESPLGEQAAKAHGVSPWRSWWSIILPRRKRSLAAACVLAALLVATELEMSVLLAEPGRATLGIRLYSLIHTAPEALVSSLTLGILAPVAAGAVILVLLLRGRR